MGEFDLNVEDDDRPAATARHTRTARARPPRVGARVRILTDRAVEVPGGFFTLRAGEEGSAVRVGPRSCAVEVAGTVGVFFHGEVEVAESPPPKRRRDPLVAKTLAVGTHVQILKGRPMGTDSLIRINAGDLGRIVKVGARGYAIDLGGALAVFRREDVAEVPGPAA
jgi:hypothetical protein